jgi:hypothetical protein
MHFDKSIASSIVTALGLYAGGAAVALIVCEGLERLADRAAARRTANVMLNDVDGVEWRVV